MPPGKIKRSWKLMVNVYVKHAPDLIVRATFAASRSLGVGPFCRDCRLYELHRASAPPVHLDESRFFEPSRPTQKIAWLSDRTLSNHKYLMFSPGC